MAISVVEVTKICTGNHYRVVIDVDGRKVEEVVTAEELRAKPRGDDIAVALFAYFADEKQVGLEGMRGKELAADVPSDRRAG